MQLDLLKKVEDVMLGLVEVEALLLCWGSDGSPFRNQLPEGDIVSFEIDQRLQAQDEFLELLVDCGVLVHEYLPATFDWIPETDLFVDDVEGLDIFHHIFFNYIHRDVLFSHARTLGATEEVVQSMHRACCATGPVGHS